LLNIYYMELSTELLQRVTEIRSGATPANNIPIDVSGANMLLEYKQDDPELTEQLRRDALAVASLAETAEVTLTAEIGGQTRAKVGWYTQFMIDAHPNKPGTVAATGVFLREHDGLLCTTTQPITVPDKYRDDERAIIRLLRNTTQTTPVTIESEAVLRSQRHHLAWFMVANSLDHSTILR